MSAELTELSRLHLDYEDAADPDDGDHPGSAEAAELSAAVGEYLAERGYAGRHVGDVVELTMRDRMAILLAEYDPNGLQPTNGELDVIMAVVESVAQTNAEWQEDSANPTTWRYARDAQRSLTGRLAGWASA